VKALDVAGTGVRKPLSAAKVVVTPPAPRRATNDPFYSDREFRALLEGRQRWLGHRRRGWLR
jgi:hypothetical protein